jgi:hypothetical protein
VRLPGFDHDCGPLLDLEHIRRQLHLGPPVTEGTSTIPVAQIIGTVGRPHDFDGCFQPTHAALRKRLDDIEESQPSSLDEAIDVVRVDRAYFVADGHKRVALARRAGREFIDARITFLPSPYAFDTDTELETIERTAREGEFRRHSGMGAAHPSCRFALTDIDGYGELLIAVQSYAFDRVLALGRPLTAAESAHLWYEDKYLPTVARGREAAGDLIASMSDADIFLALHRQERAAWGSECGDPECIPDMLLAERRRTAHAAQSPIDRVLKRNRPDAGTQGPLLLPARDELDEDAADADDDGPVA